MSEDKGPKGGKDKTPLKVDPELVRELSKLLEETGLAEIEVEQSGTRIRVARQMSPAASVPAITAAGGKEAPSPVRGTIVASPMVGTVFLSPSPGTPPFVKPGDTVKDGDTLVIVEAMKTMNQVPSTVAGRVAEIYVRDGQPVEFGEPLMRIE